MAKHVRKGDTVIVTSGDHKGMVGEILRVDTKESRVLVKGVNMHTKHVRPRAQGQAGGIIQREMPIHISKVSPVADGKPTRVRFVTKPDGSKWRVAAKGGKDLGQVSPAAADKKSPAKKKEAGKK
jgi:large subunit ribosomal protein L24